MSVIRGVKKVILKSEQYGDINTDDAKRLGHGRFYEVYKLDDLKVLKFMHNEDTSHTFPSREVLNGIPMIPEIYEFSEKQNYYIMQYINGIEIGSLGKKYQVIRFFSENFEIINYCIKNKFDFHEYIEQVDLFFEGCISKGYFPRDLHHKNIMLDGQQKIWVVDLDQFVDVPKNSIVSNYKISSEYRKMIEHGKKVENFINDTDNFPGIFQPYIKKAKRHLR